MLNILEVTKAGHGHYLVTFEKKGRVKKKLTTDLDAVERYKSRDSLGAKEKSHYDYTLKQAMQVLTK